MMQINLRKKAFTSDEIDHIIDKLERALERGLLHRRRENNPYLLASFAGVEEAGISPKWNVKIYSYSIKKRGHSIVCVDLQVLRWLIDEDYGQLVPPDLPVLRIDDAGWGFPLGGVMVGVSDERTVRTDVVPVEYFQQSGPRAFAGKRYLKEYARRAVELLGQFGASPKTHRIEICSGYINQPLRERLRRLGYDVRVVEIKGLLQRRLEQIYREYVRDTIGADIYYDPKDLPQAEIPRRYRASLSYGKKHCPHLLKTGWQSLNGRPRERLPWETQ
ncbi:MAG: hypothetical protein JXA37_09310 [Chloroflexia bacterium]|nr:hypothetical protein [Chloroflexia bacterium]